MGGGIPDPSNLVTLGDYWLEKAIQQQLIQPLDPGSLEGWDRLPQKWKELVTRRSSSQSSGKIWGAPYRWGSTVIAYRRDIFDERKLQVPTDWSDLWRPDLQGQISLLDQPREVIGLVLKKLGKSYNTKDLNSVSGLKTELRALRPQIKYYSSNTYLQPLLLGDLWLAVGWSEDVFSMMERSPAIAAVVPKSGTALWADLWVRPSSNPTVDSSVVNKWISFCWRPEIANQLSILSGATSPITLTEESAQVPQEVRSNPLLFPDSKTLELSEFCNRFPRLRLNSTRRIGKTFARLGRAAPQTSLPRYQERMHT